MPHTNTDIFLIPGSESCLLVIRYFASALHHRPQLWNDENAIQLHFVMEDHKTWYISNIILHIQYLEDLYNLWNKRVFTMSDLAQPLIEEHPLDAE